MKEVPVTPQLTLAQWIILCQNEILKQQTKRQK